MTIYKGDFYHRENKGWQPISSTDYYDSVEAVLADLKELIDEYSLPYPDDQSRIVISSADESLEEYYKDE